MSRPQEQQGMITSAMCSPNDVDGGVWQRWGGRRQLQAGVAPEAQRHDWVEGWGGMGWAFATREGWLSYRGHYIALSGRSTSVLATNQGAPAAGDSRAEGGPRAPAVGRATAHSLGPHTLRQPKKTSMKATLTSGMREELPSPALSISHLSGQAEGKGRLSNDTCTLGGAGDTAGRSGTEQ